MRRGIDDEVAESAPAIRTDYRCAANGCPNAGPFDDNGKPRSGRCYAHWREANPLKWDAITQRIRANFDTELNWGMPQQIVREAELRSMPRLGEQDQKDWARRLQQRDESGEYLTLAQRDMWRAALGRGAPQQEEDHDPR